MCAERRMNIFTNGIEAGVGFIDCSHASFLFIKKEKRRLWQKEEKIIKEGY